MGDATEDRAQAAKLPEGDLVAIIYTQHALVKDLMSEVESASGAHRSEQFSKLTAAVKAHETAEEAVVRPVTVEAGSAAVAEARNAEEIEADAVVLALSELEVDSAEFDREFAKFKMAVCDHADAEEEQEFPLLQSSRSDDERLSLGKAFIEHFTAAGGPA